MQELREMFNKAWFTQLAEEVKIIVPGFDKTGFIKQVCKDLPSLSLNERMRNASVQLQAFLSGNYLKDLEVLKKLALRMPRGYTSLVFPDYVSQYGIDHFPVSLEALKYFTVFGSSEFAIRVFIKKDLQLTLKHMLQWASDKDPHVRRLASEGSRPRLPWSFKLDEVISNPELTRPILQSLNADPELYVRKSVANHLNDISKDHPEYMVKLVKTWNQEDPHTAWIIKHASRSLIKKGHPESLSVFNYERSPKLSLKNFKVMTPKIKLGEKLKFEFELLSQKKKDQKLVVDYLLHYKRPAGKTSVKVFKLKDLNLKGGESFKLQSTQLIKDFTTRKHYPGIHKLEIQVNGKIIGENSFCIVN